MDYQSLAQNTESPAGHLTVSRYVPRSNIIYEEMKRAITALKPFDEHKRAIFYAEPGFTCTVEAEQEIRSLHAMLGLLSEMEELILCFLKYEQLDSINLKEELGDLCWYIALFCNANEINFMDMLNTNIEKLKKRYPDKFKESDAKNRNLEEERKVLESTSPQKGITDDRV